LWDLVKAVQTRGGEAVDLKISNAPSREDFQAARKILDLVRRRQPQLIHSHSSKAGALVRLLGLLRRDLPPILYTPHAYYGLGGRHSISGFFFNTVEGLLGRVGRTVCCSADERKFGVEQLYLPPRKLVVINNGINMKRISPALADEKKACRAEFGFPEKGTLLVTVGRDCAQKNYGPLYAAMDSLLANPANDCLFAHAGAGSTDLGAKLSPAAQKRFHAFTHIGPVERFLRAADGFILTSRYEGMSLGMLQALATGLKMFLTHVPGNRCLERAGFRQVEWLEFNNSQPVLAQEIKKKLMPWFANPVRPDEQQVPMARGAYDSHTQLQKLLRLYNFEVTS
jgi:glycosyltransferase involved in cell wall biosynthesis